MISLETGEIDVAFDIGIMDREAVMNHKKLELVEVEAPQVYILPLIKQIHYLLI